MKRVSKLKPSDWLELSENEVGKPQCISTPARAHIWVAINGFGRGCLSVDKSFHLVSLSHCLRLSLFLSPPYNTFLLVPRRRLSFSCPLVILPLFPALFPSRILSLSLSLSLRSIFIGSKIHQRETPNDGPCPRLYQDFHSCDRDGGVNVGALIDLSLTSPLMATTVKFDIH